MGEVWQSLNAQLQLRCEDGNLIFLFGDASFCGSWRGSCGFGEKHSEWGLPEGAPGRPPVGLRLDVHFLLSLPPESAPAGGLTGRHPFGWGGRPTSLQGLLRHDFAFVCH